MPIAQAIRKYVLLITVLATAATAGQAIDKTIPRPPNESRQAQDPRIAIAYPTDKYEIAFWSGVRPSVIVRGRISALPEGYKAFLVVHPTHTDESYAHPVSISGEAWIGQAYFGSKRFPPRDGDTYELMALLHDQPLPEILTELPQSTHYSSDIVTVKIHVTSWIDRLIVFGKDWQLSSIVVAVIGLLGAIIGCRFTQPRRGK